MTIYEFPSYMLMWEHKAGLKKGRPIAAVIPGRP